MTIPMTIASQLTEAASLINNIGTWILQTVPGLQAGRAGSDLRNEVGSMQTNAAAMLKAGILGDELVTTINMARLAGATYDTIDTLRTNLLAQMPKGLLSVIVQGMALIIVLSQQARINAGTAFVSRDDVNRMMQRVIDSFVPVEEWIADYGVAANYQTMFALRSATINDLTSRSRPLPIIVTYETLVPTPTLVLANSLYPDASQLGVNTSTSDFSDQLIAENNIVHPAFAPLTGRCLSEFAGGVR